MSDIEQDLLSESNKTVFDVVKDLAEDIYTDLDRFNKDSTDQYLHLYHLQDLIHNSLIRNGLWDTARAYQDYNEVNYRTKKNFTDKLDKTLELGENNNEHIS